jgi:3-methyladenine DNA glycosylase AlkD
MTRQTEVIRSLKKLADPKFAAGSQRFNKTGPGEYAEHDRFLGIRVPLIREQVKNYRDLLNLSDQSELLQNEWHEVRLFALLSMVDSFKRSDDTARRQITQRYLKLKKHINGWDLVDVSAPQIVGGWYYNQDRAPVDKLITSKKLWDRRIAMLATFYYIRQEDLDDTFRYAGQLLSDPEDLMHKAAGWMLREAGKRDKKRLTDFLDQHAASMPRTMLRYAIEKLSPTARQRYLNQKRKQKLRQKLKQKKKL